MARQTYKRLRDMPEQLAAAVRERIIELRTQDDPLTYGAIALRLKAEYAGVDLPTETVRSILRIANAKPPEVTVEREDVLDERQQMLKDIQERAAEFLTEYRSLPPVPDYIRTTQVEDMGFDTAQVGVALFSDLHYYSKIDRRASNGLAEYNIDIARERLSRWRNGVLRFTQMNQIWVELDELFILALGDDLEGHGKMFQSQALQMSESIIFQMMGFVEDMTGIVLSYLERYPHVTIMKVPGNHGRAEARGRGAYTPDNFELMAWEIIAERVRHQTGGEWTTSENGVRSLLGGRVDFHIHYGAIALFDIVGWLCLGRHGHGIKGLQSTYCLTPETLVLTADLRWVPAGDLREGDELVGFDDEAQSRTARPTYKNRRYQAATVTAATRKTVPVYDVSLASGETLTATGEHRFLARTKSHGSRVDWVRVDEMLLEYSEPTRKPGARVTYYLPRFLETWKPDRSYEAGLLAGAFDADGSITQGERTKRAGWGVLRFAQNDNELIGSVVQALTVLGFNYDITWGRTVTGKRHATVTVDRSQTLEFLGRVRPARLLSVWRRRCDLSDRKMVAIERSEIVDIKSAGMREVAAISSSSGTYMSAGYGSHNTGALNNKFRLNAVVGEIINYYFRAHLHEAQSSESEIRGEVIQNGSFVGPSMLSVEMSQAATNLPSQEFMLFHPKRGKTHHYRVHLADEAEVRQIDVIGREKLELPS